MYIIIFESTYIHIYIYYIHRHHVSVPVRCFLFDLSFDLSRRVRGRGFRAGTPAYLPPVSTQAKCNTRLCVMGASLNELGPAHIAFIRALPWVVKILHRWFTTEMAARKS